MDPTKMSPDELFQAVQRRMSPTVDQAALQRFAASPAGKVAATQMKLAAFVGLGAPVLGLVGVYGAVTGRKGLAVVGLGGGLLAWIAAKVAIRSVISSAQTAGALR